VAAGALVLLVAEGARETRGNGRQALRLLLGRGGGKETGLTRGPHRSARRREEGGVEVGRERNGPREGVGLRGENGLAAFASATEKKKKEKGGGSGTLR
jgi:hypothetical protein